MSRVMFCAMIVNKDSWPQVMTVENPSLTNVDGAGVLLIVVFVCLSNIGMLNILIAQVWCQIGGQDSYNCLLMIMHVYVQRAA